MIAFRINRIDHTFDGDEEMPLLWYLREVAGLKGTKFGCGIGTCGACTVHVDGRAVRSCQIPVATLEGRSVTTIEGLAATATGDLHPVQRAWIDEDVPQCGYCQAGQVMAAAAFLDEFPNPTDQDINQNLTNFCRCGTYVRIRRAIHRAARAGRQEESR